MVSRHPRRRHEKGKRERTEHDPNRWLAHRRRDLLFCRHPGVAAVELAGPDLLLLVAEGVSRSAVLARLRAAVAHLVGARAAASEHFGLCKHEVGLTASAGVERGA